MFKRSGVVTPINVLKKITAEDMPSKKMKKTAEVEEQKQEEEIKKEK